ncbi:MAG: protein translocase subunit SecF, partial [Pseudomonadota bacterium]
MRLIKQKTNINFLGKQRRTIALALSIIMMIASVVSLSTRGLDFGIDFTGGFLLEVGYEEPANLDAIRTKLGNAGFEEAQVQLFGAETDVLVRLP